MSNFLDMNGLTYFWGKIKALMFYKYYGLFSKTTTVNKDVDGNITSIVETSDEVTSTVTFSVTDNVTTVTEVIVPFAGSSKYVKTTIVTTNVLSIVTNESYETQPK
ncbi:hypothetical protein [Bacteroides sp.]|uniref:hypothetical protein n=1 Tax=Bacteroides sp. TaxID=29523 RepID=UPI00262CD2D9|nr:hypothetical protein [Bacteroides sp.]MDD3040021.1 hypothetical protein [Bacteroides sp.]